jgi:hypothetical protein
MTDLKAQAVNLGTNVAKLGLNTLNTGVEVANTGVTAVGKVAETGLITSTTVAANTGKLVSSASGIVADTVGITADLIARTKIISESAVIRQHTNETLKNSTTTDDVKRKIIESQLKTENDILQSQKAAENAKNKIEAEAENAKNKIEAEAENQRIQHQMNKQLSDEDNKANLENLNESLIYGFKTDKSPYEIGSKQATTFFNFGKKIRFFFGYYVPIGVLDTKTFELFEIVLPKKNLTNNPRIPNIINCKDENNNDVTIVFKQEYKKSFIGKLKEVIVPYVSVKENETSRKIEGELVFQKRGYFMDKPISGGKSRKHKKNQPVKSRCKKTKTRRRKLL